MIPLNQIIEEQDVVEKLGWIVDSYESQIISIEKN